MAAFLALAPFALILPISLPWDNPQGRFFDHLKSRSQICLAEPGALSVKTAASVVGGSHLGWVVEDLKIWRGGLEGKAFEGKVCLAEGCRIFQALPERCLCYPVTHGFLSPA